MDDPKSDIEDFARVIHLDPSLSAKLLKAVNSAYYGFSGEISSISRAVKLVGIQQLNIMVLSISAVTAFSALNFPKDIIDLKSFWRSSLLTGALAKLLAQELNVRPAERFFILGLLHEIGHLMLYANFPDQARKTIQMSQQSDMRINEAEQEVLGVHYGDIGAMLMAQWHLPEHFQLLTRLQPTPELATESQVEISILHVAHGYAHRQFTETECDIQDLIHPVAWENIQLDQAQIEEILQIALETSAELEKIIIS